MPAPYQSWIRPWTDPRITWHSSPAPACWSTSRFQLRNLHPSLSSSGSGIGVGRAEVDRGVDATEVRYEHEKGLTSSSSSGGGCWESRYTAAAGGRRRMNSGSTSSTGGGFVTKMKQVQVMLVRTRINHPNPLVCFLGSLSSTPIENPTRPSNTYIPNLRSPPSSLSDEKEGSKTEGCCPRELGCVTGAG